MYVTYALAKNNIFQSLHSGRKLAWIFKEDKQLREKKNLPEALAADIDGPVLCRNWYKSGISKILPLQIHCKLFW